MSSVYTASIVGLLDDMGFPAPRSLVILGVKAEDLQNPRIRVHQDQVIDLFAVASRELENPVLGLEIGERFRVETFSETGGVLSLCDTIREAAEFNGRYQSLVISSGTSGPVETDDGVFLQWNPRSEDVERKRHVTELVMGGYATTIRWLAWSIGHTAPTSVCFQHAACPEEEVQAVYTRVFGHTPRFGAAFNRVGLPLSGVDDPLPTSAPKRLTAISRDLDRIILGKTQILDEVRGALSRLLGESSLSFEAVADDVGVRSSVLSSRLKRSGTNYTKLLDEVRRQRLEELAEQKIPLAQIAAELGYSDQSALTRACRRWHGLPPSAYLEQRGEEPGV